jgi:integrase
MAVRKRKWTTSKGEPRDAYVVRYYDADGIYRLKTFKKKKAADDWAAQTKVDLKEGIHQPESTAETVGEAGEVWLGYCKDEGVEPETLRAYRRHLDYHIKPAIAPENVPNAWNGEFGNLKLPLNGPVCEAFRRRALTSPRRNRAGKIISGKKVSRRTSQHIWNSFKQMLNVAVKHGLIKFNPAHKIRLDTQKRDKIRIRIGEQIPDRPDVRDILAASTGMWLVLFSLDSFSGLRSSEIRALAWPVIDLDRGEVEVVRRADSDGEIGSCKSDAAKRTIQIPDQVIDLLRWWKPICPPSPEKLVFPGEDGNIIHGSKILNELYAVQRRIKMKRSNGKPKYTVQSLRHFYASMMIDEGIRPKDLQVLMGHSTLALTMDTYGHLFPAGEAGRERASKAFTAVFRGDKKGVGAPSSGITEHVPVLLSIASEALAVQAPHLDSTAPISRGRPPLGSRSRRTFGQKPASVLSRALSRNTALTPQSMVLKTTPGGFTTDDLCIEFGAAGWVVTIEGRTLGRYKTYAEAKETVQRLVLSDQSAH